MTFKLHKKPQHDPVENTFNALRTLLQCLENGYFAAEKYNHFACCLLEDAKILFREFWSGPQENKWDEYPEERREIMGFIYHAQVLVPYLGVGKDIYVTMERVIGYVKQDTWDVDLPKREHIALFLSHILEDVQRFQEIRNMRKHIA